MWKSLAWESKITESTQKTAGYGRVLLLLHPLELVSGRFLPSTDATEPEDVVLMEECPYALSLLRFLRWCQKLVGRPEMTGAWGEELWKEMVPSKMMWDLIPKNT